MSHSDPERLAWLSLIKADLRHAYINLNRIAETAPASERHIWREHKGKVLRAPPRGRKDGTEFLSPAWADEEEHELQALKSLAEEASSSPDWEHGETLIRDSYFEAYAQELAEDIGAINRDALWPNNHIDWPSASMELKQDYFEVDWDGETYWIRA